MLILIEKEVRFESGLSTSEKFELLVTLLLGVTYAVVDTLALLCCLITSIVIMYSLALPDSSSLTIR
jgi:hypothetical protein